MTFVRHFVVMRPTLLLVGGSLLLSACGSLPHSRYGFAQDSAPSRDIDHTRVANAVPKIEPRSKFGNPESYVVRGKRYTVLASAKGFQQTGEASWYGTKFHGHRTSSGELYNMYAMTAAHKTLPIPSYVEVRNLDNNRKVVVRVNDRGPFHEGRIIDLSYVAAKKLGITDTGTGRVAIRVVSPRTQQTTQQAATKTTAQPVPVAAATKLAANTAKQSTTQHGTSSDGAIYLQVGAFTDHNNASQLLSRLVTATTENVLINRTSSQGGNIYRVRIGPFNSEADVHHLQSQLGPQLDVLGIETAHIVVE